MKNKELKILTYNTCFGLKSNNLLYAYNSTFRVFHKRRNPDEIINKSNFSEVFQMINELNPDVLVLNEVLDDLQTIPLKKKLQELGYNKIFVGNSGHHDKPILVSTIIATRLNAEFIENKIKFLKGIPGTGGGAVGICCKDFDLCILGIHVPYYEKYLLPQIEDIDTFYKEIKDKYKNIIFTGDFNRDYYFYKKNSNFIQDFKFAKTKRSFPSFFPVYAPFVPFLKDVIIGQIDNIFYRGKMKLIEAKTINSKRSDHKPIMAKFNFK